MLDYAKRNITVTEIANEWKHIAIRGSVGWGRISPFIVDASAALNAGMLHTSIMM